MTSEFKTVFAKLRAILIKHAGELRVAEDAAMRYCVEGQVGPAALRAWGGKARKKTIPVAWVEIGKAYVSFHLMPVYGDSKLRDGMSAELRKRMQGKSCFNFKAEDEALFAELEALTARGFRSFKTAGFVQ